MIDREDQLPVTQQCKILDVNRSGIYYKAVPLSEVDRELMRQIDEIHLNYPFYGSRNIRNELLSRGYKVSRDKITPFKVFRHNLHSHVQGILLSGCHYGLAQSHGSVLATFEYTGQLILCG